QPLITVSKDNGVATVTLNRPEKLNALNREMRGMFCRAMQELGADPATAVVIITGAGRAFSAGLDLNELGVEGIRESGGVTFISVVERMEAPVIAAVNGYAIGIGCIITFCCDLIVASDRAEWRLPQVALGILPNYGGATRLARIVGKGLAMRVAMGFPLKAEEAYRIGLAQWLVPHAELMAQALAVADHVAGLPPLAVRMVKESLNRGLDIPNIADASLVDSYRFMVLEMSEDKAEAHEAWRERRKPRFRGR
ncbi:MAG TPA: enoyl-CoA hydratase-related protein, partial [Reyranella sp.]